MDTYAISDKEYRALIRELEELRLKVRDYELLMGVFAVNVADRCPETVEECFNFKHEGAA